MKTVICSVLCIVFLSSCAREPIPAHIQQQVDAMPYEQLPQNFFAERSSCGSSKQGEEKIKCRDRVRREYLANQLAREERNSK